MLKLDNISKKYDGKSVTEGLNYSFEDGKIYMIQGDSGCGKSTLLRMIAGLEKPDSGTVSTGKVSMSFQNHNLIPGLNVLENVLLGSSSENKSYGNAKAYYVEKTNLAKETLSKLGIDDPSKFPNEISGGMASRAGVARALMRDAEVYLFDEPFAGLDSNAIENTAAIIREKCKGRIVIVINHDSVSCEGFADVVLKMTRNGNGTTVLEEI